MTRDLTDERYSTAQNSVFSPGAKTMQVQVWKEVLAVLEKVVPEIKDVARL